MRFIILFGHHKVGTTSLQATFATNAAELLRQGVLYPAVCPRDLCWLDPMMRWHRPRGLPPLNFREGHNALAFSMIRDKHGHPVPRHHTDLPSVAEMFALIRAQIRQHKPHTVVILSEVLANFSALHPELASSFLQGLGADEVTLTAYLRRIDDYLIAWYGQRLRFGEKLEPFPETVPKLWDTIHFDYRKMVQGWVEAAPDAKLVLKPYARDIVDDFCRTHSLPAQESHLHLNSSIHSAFYEILRKARYGMMTPFYSQFLRKASELSNHIKLPSSSTIEHHGADLRREIHSRFGPIQKWLSDTTGAKNFCNMKDVLKLRPLSVDAANSIACDILIESSLQAKREGSPWLSAL